MKTLIRRSSLTLLLIFFIAALYRFWLLQTESVSFESDEAIVGLMARHITQGKPIPTFYYGQHYMGSLDAILIAGGFFVFGESVKTIRIVQFILYMLSIFTGYLLACEMTGRRKIALMTALLLAIPTMAGALYTTMTLGGYGELILFGNLILLLGWKVTVGKSEKIWHWSMLGLIAGLGWWTHSAIITPILVVGLMGLRSFSIRRWQLYMVAALMFMCGSAPWWFYNFNHDWAALNYLLNQDRPSGVEPLSIFEKIFAFFIFGLSALYGFRYPWEPEFQLGLVVFAAALIYLVLFSRMAVRWLTRLRRQLPLSPVPYPEAGRWIWLAFGIMALIFITSPFQDATGRYLLPLWVPLMVGVALGLASLPRSWATMALGILIAFHFSTVFNAAKGDGWIGPQLAAHLQSRRDSHDEALLKFLEAEDYQYGYANYWVSFRLAFRSGERMIFDSSLPYDELGYRPVDNRYRPYVDAVAKAERVVWITLNLPELDSVIDEKLTAAGITYKTVDFGPYHVFYDFSERVAPADFNLNTTERLETLK